MGGRGASSGGGGWASSEFAELMARETPSLPSDYKKGIALSEKYKDAYEEYGSENALVNAMSEGLVGDYADFELLSMNDDIDTAFFQTLQGIQPEYVYALRYGDIPKSGRSYNFRDNFHESGVSVVNVIRTPSDLTKRSGYYEAFFGENGLNIVGGWNWGYGGSDGEVLLHKVKKIKSVK